MTVATNGTIHTYYPLHARRKGKRWRVVLSDGQRLRVLYLTNITELRGAR